LRVSSLANSVAGSAGEFPERKVHRTTYAAYCTITVSAAVWLKLPEVAVTVAAYVPAGVPFEPVEYVDPPQPPISMKAKTIKAADKLGRRRFLTNRRLEEPRTSTHPMAGGKLADGPLPAPPDAVVETFTVTEVAELPVTLTELGTLQNGAGETTGAILHVKLTVPLKDPAGVSAKLNVAVLPAEIVDELDPPAAMPKVKSGPLIPVPETTTVCEPVPALSATIRFALTAPAAVGARITLIVQLASG